MVATTWKQVSLGQAVTLQRGFDLPHRERRLGTVPVVSSSGISGSHDTAQIESPGVVTGRYGTIGEVFFIEEDFWPLNTTLFVKDFKGNDPLFISYLLRTIDFDTHSGKSGVPGVNRKDLHGLEIELAPLPEQRAIAAVLSDVDGLIGELDKLIAKTRAIKQGTMQQLLTCEIRLPGFDKGWSVKRLREIGSFSKGKGLPKEALSSSGVLPAIPYTAIYTDFDEVIDPSKINQFIGSLADAIIINGPHLLIASSSNMLANIGKATAFLGGFDVAVGGDIILYRTAANVSFLSYLLSTPAHRRRIVFLSQGSTIRHVYASTFANYEIALPSLPEQEAIATLLCDMDAEIAALEARRDKMKAIKQGMMQALLAGRVRLIHQDTAA